MVETVPSALCQKTDDAQNWCISSGVTVMDIQIYIYIYIYLYMCMHTYFFNHTRLYNTTGDQIVSVLVSVPAVKTDYSL